MSALLNGHYGLDALPKVVAAHWELASFITSIYANKKKQPINLSFNFSISYKISYSISNTYYSEHISIVIRLHMAFPHQYSTLMIVFNTWPCYCSKSLQLDVSYRAGCQMREQFINNTLTCPFFCTQGRTTYMIVTVSYDIFYYSEWRVFFF